ncbi:hypothetical protein GCM10009555_019080 [Acrocarpospora macrocephala]|uniref:Uncharacterized protein n=1 Tax=Acrocarpospora macrocephala TaxID=150177 RepID=A0A5M3WMM3_9ACTN|nr:hypothetical protein Amac_011630 [Acrocarpospora macrocephala]
MRPGQPVRDPDRRRRHPGEEGKPGQVPARLPRGAKRDQSYGDLHRDAQTEQNPSPYGETRADHQSGDHEDDGEGVHVHSGRQLVDDQGVDRPEQGGAALPYRI